MYGNGAKIGTVKTIIKLALPPTPKDLQAVSSVCCAAAAGTAGLPIAALPIAAAAPLRTATTSAVFGWFFPSKQWLSASSFKRVLLPKRARDEAQEMERGLINS